MTEPDYGTPTSAEFRAILAQRAEREQQERDDRLRVEALRAAVSTWHGLRLDERTANTVANVAAVFERYLRGPVRDTVRPPDPSVAVRR